MTIFAPSDFVEVSVPADDRGGCGERHQRPVGLDGRPVQPWALSCPACEPYLLKVDDRWSKTIEEIAETFDEKKAREHFETRGIRQRDALLSVAMARMAGVNEIPPAVAKMLGSVPAHVTISGQLLCPDGHASALPGQRFCGQCGKPLSSPAAVAAIEAGAA